MQNNHRMPSKIPVLTEKMVADEDGTMIPWAWKTDSMNWKLEEE